MKPSVDDLEARIVELEAELERRPSRFEMRIVPELLNDISCRGPGMMKMGIINPPKRHVHIEVDLHNHRWTIEGSDLAVKCESLPTMLVGHRQGLAGTPACY